MNQRATASLDFMYLYLLGSHLKVVIQSMLSCPPSLLVTARFKKVYNKNWCLIDIAEEMFAIVKVYKLWIGTYENGFSWIIKAATPVMVATDMHCTNYPESHKFGYRTSTFLCSPISDCCTSVLSWFIVISRRWCTFFSLKCHMSLYYCINLILHELLIHGGISLLLPPQN